MRTLEKLPHNVPLVDVLGRPNLTFQSWDLKKTRAIEDSIADLTTVVADLAATVAAIADMHNENVLTPVEKPAWIKLYADILAEQPDIDAKATAYGITTEKTNYDNAITTLTNYLATLTVTVLWNNLTGNTTIVGVTFRANFTDVDTKRQLLLNKMHSSSKTLADTAQTTANTGVTNAAAAQTTANTGVTNAAAAQTTANTAVTNAAAAQTTANTGVTNAATAQTTADTVKRDFGIGIGYTIPGDILTASDAGATASIVIANHTRRYGDISDLSITGATLTGLNFSTRYYVYYTDTTRTVTTPTFTATTIYNNAAPQKVAGRHYCGEITTPADGAAATTGGVAPPSGGGGIPRSEVDGTT